MGARQSNLYRAPTAGAAVSATLHGAADISRNFQLLPIRVQRKVVRRAVTIVTRILAKRAKKAISGGTNKAIDTGLLKKSIGIRVSSPRGAPWVIIGVIGPRRGFGTAVVRKGQGEKKGVHSGSKKGISKVIASSRSEYADPAKSGPCVEAGRKPEDKNPGVRKRPYMRHTYLRSITDMGARLRLEMRVGIDVEALKLARR